jgi:hypothetical protein
MQVGTIVREQPEIYRDPPATRVKEKDFVAFKRKSKDDDPKIHTEKPPC